MTDIKDIYWLAGYLEGEGSFTIYSRGRFKQFRIEFSSSDLDIVRKTKRILKTTGIIFLRKQGYSQFGSKKKPEYYLKIYQREAIQWMMTIYSLMGMRRKAKIGEILSIWKSHTAVRSKNA